MQKFLALIVLATALLFTPAMATAADHDVKITNDTGYVIVRIHIRQANTSSWSENMLDNTTFWSTGSRQIKLPDYPSPVFDIRLVDSEGNTYTFWDFNVTEEDIIVTLLDLDVA